jgi:hypothetical protein
MADPKGKAHESAAAIGLAVLYTMTDGKTTRPATVVALEELRPGETEPRAVLSILTGGKLDRGLIEHHERQGVYEGSGQEPPVVVRAGVPFARDADKEGRWPPHSFRLREMPRVSGTAATERPPARKGDEGDEAHGEQPPNDEAPKGEG